MFEEVMIQIGVQLHLCRNPKSSGGGLGGGGAAPPIQRFLAKLDARKSDIQIRVQLNFCKESTK